MTVCERVPRRSAAPLLGAAARHDVSLTWITDSDDGPATWSELRNLDWSRFRLVLGAGGVTGAAFAAGVLLALSTDHRVDLRNASHLVGTSAGSVVAALIALGLDGDDLGAVIAQTPQWLSDVGGSLTFAPDAEGPSMPRLRNMVRPMGPRDIVRSAGLAATRRYRALWLHCVRPGEFDVIQQLPFIPELRWPAESRLSVCCTDTATGRRVVCEGDGDVDLADALAASCAVPGVMRPVLVGDRVLVDGGVVSPTSADIALADGDTSITVVVSPMSGTGARSAFGRASSRYASNRLLGELRHTHGGGGVLVIEPAGSLGSLVIDDALDESTSTLVLASSFLGPAGAKIARRKLSRRHAR